jgi:hypothetical protein
MNLITRRNRIIRDRISILASLPRRYEIASQYPPYIDNMEFSDFTCNWCDMKGCDFAYDPYNTSGDCLGIK